VPGERLDVRLLGPVLAYAGARRLDLGPRKQRLVFAILALEANRVVPVDRLVELAWPVDAPRTAAHAVRVCVSGLRSALAGRVDAEIDTRGAGYALRADPHQVDAARFRQLLKRAAAAEDDASRVALLDEALALWSGPTTYGVALCGTAPVQTQEVLCRGLEESRLAAIEDRQQYHRPESLAAATAIIGDAFAVPATLLKSRFGRRSNRLETRMGARKDAVRAWGPARRRVPCNTSPRPRAIWRGRRDNDAGRAYRARTAGCLGRRRRRSVE